jgi:hypothetical protein
LGLKQRCCFVQSSLFCLLEQASGLHLRNSALAGKPAEPSWAAAFWEACLCVSILDDRRVCILLQIRLQEECGQEVKAEFVRSGKQVY